MLKLLKLKKIINWIRFAFAVYSETRRMIKAEKAGKPIMKEGYHTSDPFGLLKRDRHKVSEQESNSLDVTTLGDTTDATEQPRQGDEVKQKQE